MYINSLEVGNFRNYDFAKIEFHDKTKRIFWSLFLSVERQNRIREAKTAN